MRRVNAEGSASSTWQLRDVEKEKNVDILMQNVMESEGVTLVVQRSTWRQIALESRPLKDHHQSRRLRRLREIKFQEEPKDPKIKEERLRLWRA